MEKFEKESQEALQNEENELQKERQKIESFIGGLDDETLSYLWASQEMSWEWANKYPELSAGSLPADDLKDKANLWIKVIEAEQKKRKEQGEK